MSGAQPDVSPHSAVGPERPDVSPHSAAGPERPDVSPDPITDEFSVPGDRFEDGARSVLLVREHRPRRILAPRPARDVNEKRCVRGRRARGSRR
ncbi:hypothetical protein [Nocardia aurantia]|uniref:hypothetical protein n=1 Tax=Nocardia aurantia TaxID=2585199 RepID=UPI001297080C|nr:hypothetical protein [Nocardia aurantia]